ncbi:MAG: molecular chaperone DnaK [Myxococcota bacterium]|nr:molecular chaperone DnaK [Myxococcota bacterium]
MNRVIGIDLGTTNSCVAVVDNGQPVVIPNTGGYKTTPSMFALAEDGKRLVGHLAKRQAITNASNTVYASKRLIGRRWGTPEVDRAIDLCPYAIVEGPNEDPRIQLGEKVFTCPEIAGIILREMKRVAQEHLGEPIREAVITVPAHFNDAQRQSTKDAGKIAGLEVLRIINEPTAAALAYGFGRKPDDEKVLIYDLGGGTFDVSILEMSDGVIEVLATAGDTFLGGEDFDRRIVNHLLEQFEAAEGIDLRSEPMALQRLKDAAEKAKCDLSVSASTEVNLPFIASDANGPRHLSVEMTRQTLEGLVGDIVNNSIKTVELCLNDAGLGPKDVDQVILVGGQTRMPMVQNTVADFFGKRPHKGVNPDEVVATGAAIQGEALINEDENLLLLDVTPLSLGIGTYGGHFAKLIDRNTTLPVRRAHVFTTTRDNQTAVKIRVLQGESDVAEENDLLGEFILSGIREARKGEPEVEVSFDIDTNGIVSVSARDLETGREQSITVNATGTLSEDEIQRIIDDNELYEVQFKE